MLQYRNRPGLAVSQYLLKEMEMGPGGGWGVGGREEVR